MPGTRATADAVKKFRGPLIEYLLSGLEENNKWIRVMAADLLGSIGDQRTINSLVPLTVDKDPDIRAVSARAVSMISSHRNFETVSGADNCGNCTIRLIAEELIKTRNAAG